jgi:hypothetical protein
MANGGFGGSPWGGSPWGGASLGDVTFRVEDATSETPFQVLVEFNQNLDPLYAPNYSPVSYSIPGLTVSAVVPGPNPYSVLLTTDEQEALLYTVTVLDAHDNGGNPIDPLFDSAVFAGSAPAARTFFATAQSNTKVQLTFSVPMAQNLAYTNPANYTITDLNGVSLPILSVTAVGPSPNRRIVLRLGTPLVAGGYYVATIASPPILSALLLTIPDPTDLFQWTESKPGGVFRSDLKISDFSGEVTGGILGEPLGLVFFSPSLDVAAPNSVIQVDNVSVCTRAYDVYTPPSPIDPNPLYTWSSNGPQGNLGAVVLFGAFDRLLGARLDLTIKPSDALAPYMDGPAVAILAEPFDPAYVSLLNNSFWNMHPGTVTFITANNLGPIPPGPTVVITLESGPPNLQSDGFGGDPWGGEEWG